MPTTHNFSPLALQPFSPLEPMLRWQQAALCSFSLLVLAGVLGTDFLAIQDSRFLRQALESGLIPWYALALPLPLLLGAGLLAVRKKSAIVAIALFLYLHVVYGVYRYITLGLWGASGLWQAPGILGFVFALRLGGQGKLG